MRFLFTFFSLCLVVSVQAQTVDSVRVFVDWLKDKENRSMALQRICEENDVRTLSLLNAIQEKRIFLFDGTWITPGDPGAENGSQVTLIELFPVATTRLQDGKVFAVDRKELEEVVFSRKDRLLIVPVIPYINLASSDVEKRKLAYTQFLGKKDQKTLATLRKAVESEQDEIARRIGQEVVYSIELQLANKDDKNVLLEKIVRNHGPNALSILSAFLEQERDPVLLEQAKGALSHVQSRSKWLEIFQNLFSGLSLGSILMLVALGLAIIYGLAGVINMAHGEFMMVGAYATFCLQELFFGLGATSDLYFWISLPVSFLVAGVFGLITERLIIRKLYSRPLESLLATWGLSLVLIQLARTIFGDLTAVKAPTLLSGGWEVVPQLVLPFNRVFIIGFSVIIILFTYWFLFRTKSGLRIRSVTQNRSMSACLGIATRKVDSLTFFIGSGIAGISGCCITLIGNVVPDMGQTYIVDSFLVVVVGGVGNLLGTILAGLGLGFTTKLLEPIFQAVYGKVILLAIIIFFLQIKPKGLFPAKGRLAED